MSERKKGIVWAEKEVLHLATTTAFYLFSPLKESIKNDYLLKINFTCKKNLAYYN